MKTAGVLKPRRRSCPWGFQQLGGIYTSSDVKIQHAALGHTPQVTARALVTPGEDGHRYREGWERGEAVLGNFKTRTVVARC